MRLTVILIFLLVVILAWGQTPLSPESIDIVRDAWGVPHIFSKTDAGVAYGLAWAHAEDDFETIQQGFLASKAMLGQHLGKSGAIVDYGIQFLKCRELVTSRYEKDISPEYKIILQAYCDGINAYARTYPKEILVKKTFLKNVFNVNS